MLRRVVKRAIRARLGAQKAPVTTLHSAAKKLTPPSVATQPEPAGLPEPKAPTPVAASRVIDPPKTQDHPVTENDGATQIAAEENHDSPQSISTSSSAPSTETFEINVADDGEKFWGDIDNESARAKARGEELIIDQWECISCGVCVDNTDTVFALPDDAKAVVLQQEGDMGHIQDALDSCPVTCIHWTDEPEQYEQTNDLEGKPL